MLYSVLFRFGHIRRWDQYAVYILYSKISTDPGLLKIRHSHRFVAVVIQFLIPLGNKTHCFPCGQSVSVLLYLPTQKYKKKLRQNYLLDERDHFLLLDAIGYTDCARKIERLPKPTCQDNCLFSKLTKI